MFPRKSYQERVAKDILDDLKEYLVEIHLSPVESHIERKRMLARALDKKGMNKEVLKAGINMFRLKLEDMLRDLRKMK